MPSDYICLQQKSRVRFSERYETLAMDEMQKDFLGLNTDRHANV